MSTNDPIIICATHDFRHVTDMFYCPLCEQERRARVYAEQKERSDATRAKALAAADGTGTAAEA